MTKITNFCNKSPVIASNATNIACNTFSLHIPAFLGGFVQRLPVQAHFQS